MNMIKELLLQEQLFPAFEAEVLPHYKKLATYLAQQHDAKQSTLLVAINGAQGTGKSTLALFLQAYLEGQGKHTAVLSIDDLYFTYQERQQLGADVHPLFKTRGVPGTHDLVLGQSVINRLLEAQAGNGVAVPAFDKAQDDRKPKAQWPSIDGPVDIILLEGWCVGATSIPQQDMEVPINELEATEDSQQTWRSYMNALLANQYRVFFSQFDLLVMLKAPSFDCVKAWRALQEEKLARKMQVQLKGQQTTNNGALNAPLKGLMNTNALNRFMMHYERLTTHMLKTMPSHANVLIELAQDHSIQNVSYRGEGGQMTNQLVVFSDLDATLLDHNDYSFDAANAALRKLKTNNIPLVLNSSKTMPEMNCVRAKLDNQDPFIIENGAALIIPSNYFENTEEEAINFSTEYTTILKTLSELKIQGFKFRHFDELTAKDVSELTNLSEDAAQMAKERFGSEPLLWDDTEESLERFSQEINSRQLKLIKGGRFYHVIGLFDKGLAIERALTFFEKKFQGKTITSVGLGDSPNDLPMLETVDIAIVIKSGRSAEMKLKNTNTIFSQQEGPAGWNEEMLKLLEKQGV